MVIAEYTAVLDKEYKRTVLKKVRAYKYEDEVVLSSPKSVWRFMNDVVKINTLAEEKAYALMCNTKMIPICLFEISHGSCDCTLAGPREIMLRALLSGASEVVLVHNHPSQDVSPSKMDRDLTVRVKEAGKIVGIKLVDHIIIGNGYYSFLEAEVL